MIHVGIFKEKVCSCMDGSVADLTKRMCPEKSSIDWQNCKCPPGYSFQGKIKKGEMRDKTRPNV